MGRPPTPLLVRLESKIERTEECWIWKAKIDPDGYGAFGYKEQKKSRTQLAHRAVYEALVGPIPKGMQLDHLCRNRPCVNPTHLEIVTPRENTLRGYGPAGINARKTHCIHGHEFTPENTYIWTKRPRSRICRMCLAINSNKNNLTK